MTSHPPPQSPPQARALFSSWWSVLVFVLAFAASLRLAAWVDDQESELLQRESSATTAAAIAVLRTAIDGTAGAAERYAEGLRTAPTPKVSTAAATAEPLVRQHPGLHAIVWLSADGTVRMESMTPRALAEHATHVLPDAQATELARRAARTEAWFVASVDGRLASVHPLGDDGVVVAVIETDEAFRGLSSLSFPGRGIRVAHGDDAVYVRFAEASTDADLWGVTGPLGLPGDAVSVTTWPDANVLRQLRRNLGRSVRWGGLLAAALLGGLVFAGQRAGVAELRARDEAARREATEARLRALNDELDARIRARTSELARSNRDLEQFAYAASHDLQEPLRMVISYLQLLDERSQGALDDRARTWLAYAVDGAERMRALVRGLLDFSRVERRGGPMESVALAACVADAAEDLRLLIDERSARVEVGELGAVRGDPAQVRQLLQNLLANAIRYSPDPPRVEIRARREGSERVVTVRDHGVGIPEDQRERVFELFQRLHTREEVEGHGIGLAVCRRIAERHGGQLSVVDTDGPGATLELRLPASDGVA